MTQDEIISEFESKEAAAGRPCIVARVKDFLQADWLDQADRDWLAGVLIGKDYQTAKQALEGAPVVDLLDWAICYDWPDCYLLGESYEPRLGRLLDDLVDAE